MCITKMKTRWNKTSKEIYYWDKFYFRIRWRQDEIWWARIGWKKICTRLMEDEIEIDKWIWDKMKIRLTGGKIN